MIWLLALGCTKEVAPTGSGTECGRLEDHPGTEFAFEAVQWDEGKSLYDGSEAGDHLHDSRSKWTTYLDVYGRQDPIPDVDLEGRDVLLWIGAYDACEPRTYTWLESFVVDGVRTVVGEFSDVDTSCDLQWNEAFVFVIDEVEGATEGDVCSDDGSVDTGL